MKSWQHMAQRDSSLVGGDTARGDVEINLCDAVRKSSPQRIQHWLHVHNMNDMVADMKSSAPLLSPILRSNTQGRLLAELMADPDDEMSLSELARRCQVSHPTILRDIDRLMAGGLVKDRRVGRSRLITMNTQHPIYAPLWQIVMYGYGPVVILQDLLSSASGVQSAYIYGSWAARYQGELGEDPRDVDVLVVGSPDPGELYDIAHKAEKDVGREVSINIITQQRWESSADGFVQTIRSRPLVELQLESP